MLTSDVKHDGRIDPTALARHLREGIAGHEDPRQTLGVSAETDDAEVARTLVREVALNDIDRIGSHEVYPEAGRHPSARPPTEVAADPSFLGRLSTVSSAELSVDKIDDVGTLLAVVRAGSRIQRRAALERLKTRLRDRRSLPGEVVRRTVQTLSELRDIELGAELAQIRAELPGTPGREARNEREQWKRLASRFEEQVAAFWDGQSSVEPIAALPGDQRALLLMRIADLSDRALRHLSAIIEGSDGCTTVESRIGLVASLRYATDRRLIPALVHVLDAERGELVARAARVLGGIEDARSHPALVERYERSFVEEERVALAGALGMLGDHRGAAEVRSLLEEEQPRLLLHALEAMESLGSAEHTDRVVRFLDHPDIVIATHAVRTMGRIGDGRVLDELAQKHRSTSVPALKAAIEDALSAVVARMELRGEEATVLDWSEMANAPASRKTKPESLSALVWSWRDYALGRAWLLFGKSSWAIARFEAASTRHNAWVAPLIGIGMAFARSGQYALALPAFRRAIELDRLRIERNPILVRAMAKAFLHRAEQVESEGRNDVARGLVGEALALDLRRAPSTVRVELKRKHEAFRREEQPHVDSAA